MWFDIFTPHPLSDLLLCCGHRQCPRSAYFLVGLNHVADLKVLEVQEAEAALATLAHLRNILLVMFEGLELA